MFGSGDFAWVDRDFSALAANPDRPLAPMRFADLSPDKVRKAVYIFR